MVSIAMCFSCRWQRSVCQIWSRP